MNPIESVAAVKGQWAKFDKALEGVSAERKAEIQRLIANLDLTPDDPVVIAAALLGHLAKAGEEVPESIRQAGNQVSQDFKNASGQTIQGLRDVVAALNKIAPALRNQISQDMREEAHTVLRETLDKLAEGSERASVKAQETALASARKQFSEQAEKLLSGLGEKIAVRERVAFWKGVAYAALVASGTLLLAVLYLLP